MAATKTRGELPTSQCYDHLIYRSTIRTTTCLRQVAEVSRARGCQRHVIRVELVQLVFSCMVVTVSRR